MVSISDDDGVAQQTGRDRSGRNPSPSIYRLSKLW
jgi:hypothetical protein